MAIGDLTLIFRLQILQQERFALPPGYSSPSSVRILDTIPGGTAGLATSRLEGLQLSDLIKDLKVVDSESMCSHHECNGRQLFCRTDARRKDLCRFSLITIG